MFKKVKKFAFPGTQKPIEWRFVYKETRGVLLFILLLAGTRFRALPSAWALACIAALGAGVLLYEEMRGRGVLRARSLLSAGVGGLVMGQVGWIMSLIPLHPISLASAITLIYLTFRHLLEKSLEGRLYTTSALQGVLICAIVMLVIFSASSWSL